MSGDRLMTLDEAARYCRYSVSGFRAQVSRGLLPGPIPGTHRWDRKAIDRALDNASGIKPDAPPSPFQEWKRQKDARRA